VYNTSSKRLKKKKREDFIRQQQQENVRKLTEDLTRNYPELMATTPRMVYLAFPVKFCPYLNSQYMSGDLLLLG
jgi:hypothetical protein